MNSKTNILLTATLILTLATGCSHLYEQQETTQTFDEPVVATASGVVSVSEYTAATGQQPPAESVIPAGQPVNVAQYKPVPAADLTVNALHAAPVPYADVAGYALSGLLSVGALWLNRKRKLAETAQAKEAAAKEAAETVNKSFVQGIESFRDILDHTEEGRALDAKLKRALKDKQNTLEVTQEIAALLARYTQPRTQ